MAYVQRLFAGASVGFVAMQKLQKNETEDTNVEARRAICILETQPNEEAKGIVHFEQKTTFAETHITGEFKGLWKDHKHGFHIHQYGNLLKGCATAGPHFNPFNQTHGGPGKSVRHVGDLGNVQSDDKGEAKFDLFDK